MLLGSKFACIECVLCRTLLYKNQKLFCNSTRSKKSQQQLQTFKQFRRQTDPHEIAKEFFDINYAKSFNEEWPAIRSAMLSRKKYGVVINNFANTDKYEDALIDNGAYDFMLKFHQKAAAKCFEIQKVLQLLKHQEQKIIDGNNENNFVSEMQENSLNIDKLSNRIEMLNDKHLLYNKLKTTCAGVRVYVYPKGDFKEMNQTVKNFVHHGFVVDASSMLPVIALDPQPHDSILDLCAAPGEKINILVQAYGGSEAGGIVANDLSMKKVNGVKQIISQFLSRGIDINHLVKTSVGDMTELGNVERECYSKVLVDVPCTMDRKSMYSSDMERDNIFSITRKQERAGLPELQSLLLKHAVLSCQPDGVIVYSTSTASHTQNQFVIQYTLQNLFEEHNVVCEVEDLHPLTDLLQDEFFFHDQVNIGVLVKPRLAANFGPTYVCKLRRLT